MVDRLSPERRSRLMSRVKSKDTSPEMIVRRTAHSMGLRFRTHRRDLPGTPDLVMPRRRLAVFVDGCFWHRHPECRKASMPKSNVAFWEEKFCRNVERDAQNRLALESRGWNVSRIWECEARDEQLVREILTAAVSDARENCNDG